MMNVLNVCIQRLCEEVDIFHEMYVYFEESLLFEG